MGLLWFLLVGLIAGSIANSVMNRGGKGLGSSLLLGVVGAFVGGPLLGLIGVRAFPLHRQHRKRDDRRRAADLDRAQAARQVVRAPARA
ncbi:MAG TPA: GlsB/YeaQ/YmgE family stress response membrane protein [Gemmatimonadaceae bacterium]|nr:GlsB/YeaQ/YmgE family stress response membrane protein [Gemmatimonadaceae bacterium]